MTKSFKLTDLDLVLLSGAAARADGMVLPPPETVRARGKALEKALAKLLRLGLTEECPATTPEEAWRQDDNGRGVGLRIAGAGRNALGLDDTSGPSIGSTTTEQSEDKQHEDGSAETPADGHVEDDNVAPQAAPTPGIKPGTKQAKLVHYLSRAWGISIADLSRLLGWQPHTVRAAITGLRKKGYQVTNSRNDAGETVYLATPPAGEASHAA